MTDVEMARQAVGRWKATAEALARDIWSYAELPYCETKSAAALCGALEREGFSVETHVAGIPTCFTAVFRNGTGTPVVGLLAEFDALDGLSQRAAWPEREAVTPGGAGHGCGHNLLGAGCFAAAMAIRDCLVQEGLDGSVVFFGCPAEEGAGSKQFMARAGCFDGIDFALTWHPATVNQVCKDSSLANFQVLYEFKGISAHAAGCPEMGRSALDALEIMNVGTNFLREHMIDKARVHYAITDTGGYSPNVVQSEAKAIYLIRAPKVGQAAELYKRVDKIAEGAAIMTETTYSKQLIKSCANLVSNRVLEQALYEAMQEVGVPSYTEDAYERAEKYTATTPAGSGRAFDDLIDDHLIPENVEYLREKKHSRINDFIVPYETIHLVKCGGGSTDVGDASWMCPTAQINTATWAPQTPGHSWQVVSQGKSEIAHKGMLYAGKSIALAAIKMMEEPERIAKARKEYDEVMKDQEYIPIPEGIEPRPISAIK